MTLEVEATLELDNFELDVEFEMKREIFALLGKSGAGKSLTLDTVAGFVSPDRGRISLDDRLLFDSGADVNLEPDRREVGYVLQQGYLFEHMSVERNLNYGCRFRDQGPDYETVLDVLNLKPLLDRSPRNLSGGEKQRVALGRALLTAPRLLLLDEPVSNLDQAARRQILKYVRKVHATFDLPVLYVSHAYREVEFLTDRIGLIDEGRLSKICQPEAAFEHSGALTPGQN